MPFNIKSNVFVLPLLSNVTAGNAIHAVSSSTVLKYQIAKDGRLLDYNVITSSGDKYFDKAAIDALKKSAPFAPLPKEFTGDKIEVQFTFDYNVHKK